MSDGNFEWLVNAKRHGIAPARVDARSPSLEVEMWHNYRARLLAELAQVERILRDAAVAAQPR